MNTVSLAGKNNRRLEGAILGIATIAYFIFAISGFLSMSHRIEDARLEVKGLESDLQAQSMLQPVHTRLQNSMKLTLPAGIQSYERESLEVEDLTSLPAVFEDLASEAGVELVSATPQARSLQDGRAMLRVDARMRGNFLSFNALLNRLVEVQFVDAIESLGIDVTELGQELSLSVWLSIR